jgi:hypothetical protein
MHDARGRELKQGDRVLIPAVVKQCYGGEDYCNVEIETAFGRRPDGDKEQWSAVNTGVMLRANEGDENNEPFMEETEEDIRESLRDFENE